MDLKAALAANAAMIRSMQEDGRSLSAQRDLVESRGGEWGHRREGSEDQASFDESGGVVCVFTVRVVI